MLPFASRASAGRLLASKLKAYEGEADVVVLALPHGGVPVATKIAQHLHAPLDVIVVRKVGVPWQPELALGAVSNGGVRIIDQDLLRTLGLSNYLVYDLVQKQEEEAGRLESLLRRGHPAERLRGRTVILVDDGAATGSTMLAALETVLKHSPKQIVVALPVASREATAKIKCFVDQCFCLETPSPFFAVSHWYKDFPQVSDQEVRDLLDLCRANERQSDVARSQAASG